MRQTVIILGGGIGGLSTAHELADRGFEVRGFESKPIFDGKARSIPVPNSAVEGRKRLRGVLDNPVPTTRTALARAGAPDRGSSAA